ncbi:hypothetical protein HK097_006913 [Rhizophlyctis rosea]|uniref:Protein kinase domain-containing protein n=1 Tax=Rhizophlyctis rosea TaxID=64517 RepID=A0AAD5X699_9FUNG|nr:hypothetical protein HK097_006913 [Rhizophlyctis rosea]
MASIFNRFRDLLKSEPGTSSSAQQSSVTTRNTTSASRSRSASRSSPKRVKSPVRRNSLKATPTNAAPVNAIQPNTRSEATTHASAAPAAGPTTKQAQQTDNQKQSNKMAQVAPSKTSAYEPMEATLEDGTPLESAGPPLVKYPYLSRYKMLSQMGEGAFSIVYKALDTQTKRMVAVKLVAKAQLNDQQRNNILREVSLLKRLSHPNIIRLVDFHDTPIHYALILELMTGGEIFHQLVKKTCFSEPVCRHIITQVAEGIRYLHVERGVVHRDIKLENLLYEAPDPRRIVPGGAADPSRYNVDEDYEDDDFHPGIGGAGVGLVKIADFGLSKIIFDASTKTPCGTVGYTAPEILRDERYSKGVDMWALGCVLYTLLSGFPPFFDDSPRGLTEKVANGQFAFLSPWWDDISLEAKDLVRRLLEVDTAKRYTIDEFLRHPWIKGRKFASRYRQMPAQYAAPPVHTITTTTAADASSNVPVAEDVIMAESGPHASNTDIRDAAKETTHAQPHQGEWNEVDPTTAPQPVPPPAAPAADKYPQAHPDDNLLLPNPNAPVPGWPTLPPVLKTPVDEMHGGDAKGVVAGDAATRGYFPTGVQEPVNPALQRVALDQLTPFNLPSPAVPGAKDSFPLDQTSLAPEHRKQMVLSAPAPPTYDQPSANESQPEQTQQQQQQQFTPPSSYDPLPTPRRARRTPLPLPEGVTKEMLAAPFAIYQSLAEVREEEEDEPTSTAAQPVAKHNAVRDLATGGKGVGTPGQMGRQMGGGMRRDARNPNFNLDIGSSRLFNRRVGHEQV